MRREYHDLSSTSVIVHIPEEDHLDCMMTLSLLHNLTNKKPCQDNIDQSEANLDQSEANLDQSEANLGQH